jgi:hypothetical protein
VQPTSMQLDVWLTKIEHTINLAGRQMVFMARLSTASSISRCAAQLAATFVDTEHAIPPIYCVDNKPG